MNAKAMTANGMRMIVTTLAVAWSAAALAQQAPQPDTRDVRGQAEERAKPKVEASPAVADSSREPRVRSTSRADRLELDTTVVTGNRELPKVLYIVPWKKAGIGDLPAQPFNTLLDEMLMPVDRDVFRREVTYYDALSSAGAPPGGASAAGGDAGGHSARSPADGSEK